MTRVFFLKLHKMTIIFFFFSFSLLLTVIYCASPRLIALEDGHDLEMNDYGFYPLTPVSSYDALLNQLKTPRPSPRIKSKKTNEPPSIDLTDSCTTATSSTRSRRNTIEAAGDLESGDLYEMPLSPSSTPKSVPLSLARRYCCFCFSDNCLNCVHAIFSVCYCLIYILILRLSSVATTNDEIPPPRTNRNKLVYNL